MLRISSSGRFKGRIKSDPEDFVVEEISKQGAVLEVDSKIGAEQLGMQTSEPGKFAVFVMQKKNWNTIQALKIVAKKAGRGIRSVGFAGTKDRASISTQLCSVFGTKAERLLSLHVKDISINGAWQSDTGVEMGDLLGNRFTVTLRESDATQDAIDKTAASLNGTFPNYFGEQRFGFRSNNVEIGLSIMKGDFEGAAIDFLTNTSNERNLDSIEARERLSKDKDFKSALEYFPQYLKYERMLLDYLSKYPTDYANAIRRLPRQLSLMFVHSVEGLIFNEEVEARIKSGGMSIRNGDLFCPADAAGFPDMQKVAKYDGSSAASGSFLVGNIVGYETKELNDDEKAILERLGMTQEMFKIHSMPELSSRGNYRTIFAPFVGFKGSTADNRATLSFSLPSGSYATEFLKEFVSD